MRLLFLILLALCCLIQYPLWWGPGGWYRVWDLQRKVAQQKELNDNLRARNAALDAEVQDLKTGTGAIEDRARSELGMMRDGEVYVQIVPQGGSAPSGAAGSAASGTITAAPAATAQPASAKPATAKPAVKPAAQQPAQAAAKPAAAGARPPAAAPKPATKPATVPQPAPANPADPSSRSTSANH
jgi:cell division protein FtsB